MKNRAFSFLAMGVLLAGATPVYGQVDYRNLDDDRPTRTEDAMSIERYAFEALFSYGVEREKTGGHVHTIVPELAYGLFPNFHVGLKAPLALLDGERGTEIGLSGLRAFALYNVTVEGPVLPAIALRVDGGFPVGALSGSETWVMARGIFTRSFGKTRAHLNGAWRFGAEGTPALVESPGRWWAGIAIDRTFYRQSLLLIGETWIEQASEGLAVNGTVGLRYQWTPTTVLDVGISRGFRAGLGPDVSIKIGFCYVFGIRALMPGAK